MMCQGVPWCVVGCGIAWVEIKWLDWMLSDVRNWLSNGVGGVGGVWAVWAGREETQAGCHRRNSWPYMLITGGAAINNVVKLTTMPTYLRVS